MHRTLCALLPLAALIGCAGGYENIPATATAGTTTTTPSSQTNSTTVPGPWTAVETGVMMYSVDEVLNQMFIDTPTGGGRGFVSSNGVYTVNMTSGCSTSLGASAGSINVTGTYTPDSNSTGTFNLSLNFVSCPMKGQDGATYTVNGQNFVVNGQVSTSTGPDGTVLDVYTCPSISGTAQIADPNGNAVSCAMAGSNDVNYAWDTTLSISGAFNGTVCTLPVTGTVSRSLPVVAP